ncbi:hypothetical protein CEXT_518631 [Caerostris extrusa]|uniref:Uncharacterized protein n=1 Tax=Caerostris extrusa TaxID=172846 RepID=A0AAV4TUV6_CAEEX|nr:hypothetical protein CEXT_518631 [Caerostris extrusa]
MATADSSCHFSRENKLELNVLRFGMEPGNRKPFSTPHPTLKAPVGRKFVNEKFWCAPLISLVLFGNWFSNVCFIQTNSSL